MYPLSLMYMGTSNNYRLSMLLQSIQDHPNVQTIQFHPYIRIGTLQFASPHECAQFITIHQFNSTLRFLTRTQFNQFVVDASEIVTQKKTTSALPMYRHNPPPTSCIGPHPACGEYCVIYAQ